MCRNYAIGGLSSRWFVKVSGKSPELEKVQPLRQRDIVETVEAVD